MTIGPDGGKSWTDANGSPANHPARPTSRSINHPMSTANHPREPGTTVAKTANSIPAPVNRPLKGTIGRLARIPIGEIRWKVEARIGAVPRNAAIDSNTDVATHRHGTGSEADGTNRNLRFKCIEKAPPR